MRRSLFACSGAVLLVVAAVGFASRERVEPAIGFVPVAGPEAPRAATSPVSGAERPRRRWALGDGHEYEASCTTSLTAGGDAGSRVAVSARVALTVVREGADEVVLRGELSNVRWEPARSQLPEGLSAPFYLELGRDGGLRSPRFLRGASAEVRALQRRFAAALQVVDDEAPRSWTKVELEPEGEVESAYTWTGVELSKTRVRYVTVRTLAGVLPGGAAGYGASGESRVTLGGDGWPKTVFSSQRDEIPVGPARLIALGSARADLIGVASRPELVAAFEKDRASFDPDVEATAEVSKTAQRDVDRALLGEANLASLLAAVDANKDGPARGRAVLQLSALMRVDPLTTRDVALELKKAPTGPRSLALLGALGGAGTPDAHHALGKVLASDAPSETRVGAAHALAMAPVGTAEGRRALVQASTADDANVASAATLALGAQVGKAGDPEAPDIAAAIDGLLARLRAATSISEIVECLLALGNTRSTRALPAIIEQQRSSAATVRAAAVSALRFLEVQQATDAIVGALLLDPSVDVRLAAVSTAEFRPLGPLVRAFIAALARDRDGAVRLALVRALGRGLDVEPEVAEALARAANADADPEVRAAATAALSHAPT